MGSYNQTAPQAIHQRLSRIQVHPINCVPDDRPHGSWTNSQGMEAW